MGIKKFLFLFPVTSLIDECFVLRTEAASSRRACFLLTQNDAHHVFNVLVYMIGIP